MTDPLLTPQDLRVLRTTLRWHLSEAGWVRVDEALHLVDTAIARRDSAGVRRGVTALRLCGPKRVATRVTGDAAPVPRSPAPETVVELVNRMVHSLELPPTAEPRSPTSDG